jgi:hypothetical protein
MRRGRRIRSGEFCDAQAGGGPTTVTFGTNVPEASTWGMVFSGFASLGQASHRRSKSLPAG